MRRGFTLIEMLVVILLLAFVTSIVAPAGYTLLESVQKRLAHKEAQNRIKHLRFEAFIAQKAFVDENISMLGISPSSLERDETGRYHD